MFERFYLYDFFVIYYRFLPTFFIFRKYDIKQIEIEKKMKVNKHDCVYITSFKKHISAQRKN